MLRVAIVAAAMIAFAAFALRSMASRVRSSTAPTANARRFDVDTAIRGPAERLLERMQTPSRHGEVLCAVALAGAEAAQGLRRRAFVMARCQELCVVGAELMAGTGTAFPAALILVRDQDGWHPVGAEMPTDAHYARDLDAIFPPVTRQHLRERGLGLEARARLGARVAERWPTTAWRGDSAPPGCINVPDKGLRTR